MNTRKYLYQQLIQLEYKEIHIDNYIIRKLTNNKIGLTPNSLAHMHAHFRHLHDLNPFHSNVQFKITCNALPTRTRMLPLTYPNKRDRDNQPIPPCLFCGRGADSITHIYEDCYVVAYSRQLFTDLTGEDVVLSEVSKRQRTHLAFPPTSARHSKALVSFHSAVWSSRSHRFAHMRKPRNAMHAVKLLSRDAADTWLGTTQSKQVKNDRSRRNKFDFGSAGKRTQE